MENKREGTQKKSDEKSKYGIFSHNFKCLKERR